MGSPHRLVQLRDLVALSSGIPELLLTNSLTLGSVAQGKGLEEVQPLFLQVECGRE